MTSQVVVVNERAIAVASDSTTTVSDGEDNYLRSHQSRKIFDIGEGHRIAVLHSNSLQVMGIPITVALEEWARWVETPLPTVADYRRDFVEWFMGHRDLVGADNELPLFRDLYEWCLLAIREEILRIAPTSNSGSVEQAIDGFLDPLRTADDVPTLEAVAPQVWLASVEDLRNEVFDWALDDVPHTSRGDELLRTELPWLLATKVCSPWGTDEAHFVFVGFGAEEFFPARADLHFAGALAGRCLARFAEEEQYSVNASGIATVAQGDFIHTVMRGFHFQFIDAVNDHLAELVDAAAELMALSPGSSWNPEKFLREAKAQTREAFDEASWDMFISPLLRTVEVMPPVELGRFAAQLVEVQSLRAAAEPGQSTVGGPTEAAFITRAKGVQWVV